MNTAYSNLIRTP